MQSLKELFEEFNEIFSNTDNLDNINFQEKEIDMKIITDLEIIDELS